MRRCKICTVDIDDERLIPLCVSCKIAGAWGGALTFAVFAIIKGLLYFLGLSK